MIAQYASVAIMYTKKSTDHLHMKNTARNEWEYYFNPVIWQESLLVYCKFPCSYFQGMPTYRGSLCFKFQIPCPYLIL